MSEAVSKSKSCEHIPQDAQGVIAALEQAGKTLLALRQGGYHTGLAQLHIEILPERWPGFVPDAPRMRIPAPTQQQVIQMDKVFDWVLIIPIGDHLLRRIVHARCLVHPVTERHLYGWRKIASTMGTDYRLVQRRHEKAIKIILGGLFKWITTG